jgi:hypothetical protein
MRGNIRHSLNNNDKRQKELGDGQKDLGKKSTN